ncbi:MAG: HAMP domain-containing histidine kinase [Gammaproteobacteria bacterium]|nr:HAMP domain-containing histidine kinase [Gammaproteobacteria bacterium]
MSDGPAGPPTVHPYTAQNLRRLVMLRTIAIPGAALVLLLAGHFYNLPIRAMPLLTIIVVLAVVNFSTWQRLQTGGGIPDGEFFMQMLVDVAALTGMLYYSGGSSNPFAYFFLLPLAISATVLPRRYAWPLAVITAACYTLLLFYRVPLPPFSQVREGPTFLVHIVGMWVGFVLAAGLLAYFVQRMGESLRQHERDLAEARERALRDERVVAVATLAAGAAHELSTPLATMALVTSELAEDYPRDRYPHLHENLELLRSQIRKCKDSLSVISATAGVHRAEAAHPMAVDAFVSRTVAEVRQLRPGANLAVHSEGPRPAPQILVERTLSQALLNVLHNAVDVSPEDVRVTCSWDTEQVRIAVRDHGPGISLQTLHPGDEPGRSTKESGLGLGLFLTHTALSHLGGDISFSDAPGGGARVTVNLPLARLQTGT